MYIPLATLQKGLMLAYYICTHADSTNFLRLPCSSASNGTDYINATFLNVSDSASHGSIIQFRKQFVMVNIKI